MKKITYALMAAALSLGLAAPSFAAVVPSVQGTTQVTKVQAPAPAPAKKKAAKKKTAKKPMSKKKTTTG